ncbi:MAG: hypothetical protein PVG32_16235 [Anaerolineales bacterium]
MAVSEYTGVKVSEGDGEAVIVGEWVMLGVCEGVFEGVGVPPVLVIVGVGLPVGVTVLVIVVVLVGLRDWVSVVVAKNPACSQT